MLDLFNNARAFIAKNIKDSLIVCAFLIYAIFMTWPFAINPLSTFVSAPIGDVVNSITKFETIKNEGLNPFVDGRAASIAVPDGIKSNVGVDRVSFFSTLALWIPSIVINPIFAQGLFTFSAYFLSSVLMYFLISRYMSSRYAGVYAGFALTSFPLFVGLARAAPVYMHAWLYLLPIIAFLNLSKKYSKLNILLAIVSVIPGLYWTPYIGFHVMLISGTMLLFILWRIYKDAGVKNALATTALFSISWIIILITYYAIGLSSPYSEVPDRPLNEIYEQSLHPLMLALPPAFTWWGQAGHDLLVSLEPRSVGTNLYVGVSTIGLALTGIVYLFLHPEKFGKKIRILGLFGFSITTVAFAFSIAPSVSIIGLDVPTPSSLIATYVPALRAGQRLVMPIMIGLIILASLAVSYFDKNWDTSMHIKMCVFLVFISITTLDLSIKVPELTAPAPQPDVAYTLRDRPPGNVAQYINGSLTGDPSQIACKLYMIHNKPIINYCGLDIFYPNGQLQTVHRLSRMTFVNQIAQFQEYGVRYIIVQNDDKTILDSLYSKQSVYKYGFSDDTYTIFEIK